MSLTREEAVEKLLAHYDEPYHASCAPADEMPLAATASMHLVSDRMLLSLARMGVTESDDFVFIYSLDTLTLPLLESLCDEALSRGLARVDPNPNHNFSLISLFFLCDAITPEAAAAVKKKKFHKDYAKPEAGWADLRIAAAVVGSRTGAANPMGKTLLKIYKDAMKH